MYNYLIIFLIIYLFSYAEDVYKEKKIFPYILIPLLILFFFTSFRYQTGGDWKQYYILFESYRASNISFNLLEENKLYKIISWFFSNFFNSFFLHNIFLSLLFVISFYIFIKKYNKNTITSIIILYPIGILLLVMGYIKQSLALTFLFLFIVAFLNKKKVLSIIFFLLGCLSHLSLIVFLPILLALIKNKYSIKINNYFTYLFSKHLTKYFISIIIFILYLLNVLIFFELQILNLVEFQRIFFDFPIIQNFEHYAQTEIESKGSIIRISLAIISIFFCIIYFERLVNMDNESTIFIYFLLLFITILILNLLISSTIADRLNLYTIPFQIIIITKVIELFKNKLLLKHLIITPYFIYLFVWINYSSFSLDDWQPYISIIDIK